MSDEKVVSTILGEVSFRERGSLRSNMAMIADTIMNRADMTGVSPHEVVSVRSQYNGYNKPAPGANQFRGLARDVWNEVKSGRMRGLTKGATYYATPAAVDNLPSGLVPTAASTGHMFFADPQNRSILTARGYRQPDPARLSSLVNAPVPTARPAIESRYQTQPAMTPAQQAIEDVTAQPASFVSPFGPALEDRVTSAFGYRESPMGIGSRNHKGIDMSIGPGVAGYAARATAAGRVSFAGQTPGYGNMVEVTHENGMKSRYGHLGSISVAIGDVLGPNDEVGTVGNTGRSTAPHLHFEMMDPTGRQVNPADYIDFTMDKSVPAPSSRAQAVADIAAEREATQREAYQEAATSMLSSGVRSLGHSPRGISRENFNSRVGPAISQENFDARTAPRSAPLGTQFSPSLQAALSGGISRENFAERAGPRQISQAQFDQRFGAPPALGPQFSPSLQEAMAPAATKGSRPGVTPAARSAPRSAAGLSRQSKAPPSSPAPTQLASISVSAPAPSRADQASTRAQQSKAPPSTPSSVTPTASQMSMFGAGSLSAAQRADAEERATTGKLADAYDQMAQTATAAGVASLSGQKQFDPLQGYTRAAPAAPKETVAPTAPAAPAAPVAASTRQTAVQAPAVQSAVPNVDMRPGSFPAAPDRAREEKGFVDTLMDTLFSPSTIGRVAGAALAGPVGASIGGAVGKGIANRGSVSQGSTLYDGPINNIGTGARAAYGAYGGPAGTQARATDGSVITKSPRGVERYNPKTGITTVTTGTGQYTVGGPGLFGILSGMFGIAPPANSTMGQRAERSRGGSGRGGLNDYGRGVAEKSGQFGGAVDRGDAGLW